MRRKGQSLEFRDFAAYTPGDDIRHVDWTASFRHSLGEELLVKNFAAEEQMTLAISVDVRESMKLPGSMPKLQIAAWLAEAVARIALASGDRVLFHPLFGQGLPVFTVAGPGQASRIRETFQSWALQAGEEGKSNLDALRGRLPPACVWMILTDVYFGSGQVIRELSHQIGNARRGHRWIVLADLDSWPSERAALGIGARKIEGPGLAYRTRWVDISHRTLRSVESRIEEHKTHFRELVDGAGLDWLSWHWPPNPEPDGLRFFKDRFFHDPVIRRLFMKET